MNINNKTEEIPLSDWRAHARALAMQCLAQFDVQGDDFLMEMDHFIAEANIPSNSKSLASELSRIAWSNHQVCDNLIAQTVKHWQLQRIALIDRSILRLAIAELLFRPEVPVKVVLDQAIELSKKYSTAESPQFINGVLDAIARKIQETASETIAEEAAETPEATITDDSAHTIPPADCEFESQEE